MVNAGLPFRVYETHRGRERQEDGVRRGVSRAHYLQSYHNYGLAADFVGWVNGSWTWDNSLPWDEVGRHAAMEGLNWGGNWSGFVDRPHVQFSDFKVRDLKNGLIASPDLSEEVWGWACWAKWFWEQAPELRPAMARTLQEYTGASSSDYKTLINKAALKKATPALIGIGTFAASAYLISRR